MVAADFRTDSQTRRLRERWTSWKAGRAASLATTFPTPGLSQSEVWSLLCVSPPTSRLANRKFRLASDGVHSALPSDDIFTARRGRPPVVGKSATEYIVSDGIAPPPAPHWQPWNCRHNFLPVLLLVLCSPWPRGSQSLLGQPDWWWDHMLLLGSSNPWKMNGDVRRWHHTLVSPGVSLLTVDAAAWNITAVNLTAGESQVAISSLSLRFRWSSLWPRWSCLCDLFTDLLIDLVSPDVSLLTVDAGAWNISAANLTAGESLAFSLIFTLIWSSLSPSLWLYHWPSRWSSPGTTAGLAACDISLTHLTRSESTSAHDLVWDCEGEQLQNSLSSRGWRTDEDSLSCDRKVKKCAGKCIWMRQCGSEIQNTDNTVKIWFQEK